VPILAFLLIAAAGARCEPPVLAVSLGAAEKAALAGSAALQALEAEIAAARARAGARRSLLRPRVTADASWKFLSEVPSISIPGKEMPLGDNNNYTLGPTLNWTLWDQGALREAWRASLASCRSKEDEAAAARGQTLLRTRTAYFQAQLCLEEVRLLSDSLRLAQSQHKDIEDRRKAGVSSLVDSLCAHQEVLMRARRFRQARAELAEALRDLFALTGEEPASDLSLPLDSAKAPDGTEPPSAVVALDPLKVSTSAFPGSGFDEGHPALAQWKEASESFLALSRSSRAGLWPRLSFSARTSWDYPNGPILESFNQNSVGLGLSFPLFEADRSRLESDEALRLSEAALGRMSQARRDRRRDWLKAKDRLLSLLAQREIDKVSTAETQEISRRFYDSYKAGRSTFLEVQTANLRELEARVQAARTDAQTLLQFAVIDELSKRESP
jgi:outer membrane protein TolC